MLETKTNEDRQNGLDLDLKTFELEIEKEIDSLFIPLGNEAEAKLHSAPPSMEIERPAPPVQAPPAQSAAAPISREISISFDPPQSQTMVMESVGHDDSPAPAESEDFTLVLESPDDPSDELKVLIESLQASYLSFDWDFSSPNVAALGEVLNKLEPHCMKAPETESLFKIMKAVLQRVSVRPDTVSPQLVEVMRDAQGLLKRFLVPDGVGATPDDRSRLKDLIARVHAIRNAQMSRDTRPTGSSMPAPAGRPADSAPLGEPSPSDGFIALEGGPENLGDWIEQAQRQLALTLHGVQDVNRRLSQLEEILVSKPALSPLTSRIKTIRTNLEQQLACMRSQESFWSRLTAVIRERGLQLNAGTSESGPLVPNGKAAGGDRDPAESSVASFGTTPASPRTQREQVCLITLSGRRYAVLAANVVKVQPVTGRKMTGISNRGYGILKDFKPFYKSIKAGLFGTWIGLPANALKTYQFMPVTFNGLNVEEPTPETVKGAVLISNGQQHGIIWSESGSVDLVTETIDLSSSSKAILGRIRPGSDDEIPVLHVDHLLRAVHHDEEDH
jgi:hypothetical protein